jgi:hypothetical protein
MARSSTRGRIERSRSAARAAKAAGYLRSARARYGALAELWKDADADLPELAEVKAGANENAR